MLKKYSNPFVLDNYYSGMYPQQMARTQMINQSMMTIPATMQYPTQQVPRNVYQNMPQNNTQNIMHNSVNNLTVSIKILIKTKFCENLIINYDQTSAATEI